MQIPQAPAGMTYFEFIADRIDAAKTIEPSRCGWGILLTLAVLGPIYSIAYTEIGIHPQGALAQRADPDADIPTYVAAANWSLVPGIWWGTVERLSWTFLATHRTRSCSFRAVAGAE